MNLGDFLKNDLLKTFLVLGTSGLPGIIQIGDIIYSEEHFEEEIKTMEIVDEIVFANKSDLLIKFKNFLKNMKNKDPKKRNDLIDTTNSFNSLNKVEIKGTEAPLKFNLHQKSYIVAYYGRKLMGVLISENFDTSSDKVYREKLNQFDETYLRLKKRFEGN